MITKMNGDAHVHDVSGAVGRAFTVLYAVAGHRGISFGDLERACSGLAKATLVRLVRTLVAAGLIEKNQVGLYVLGTESFHFARTVLRLVSRDELVLPLLTALADDTRESAAYFEFDGLRIKLLNKVEKPESFHYIPVGRRTGRPQTHVYARVILAFGPKSFARRILALVAPSVRENELKLHEQIRAAGLHAGSEEAGTPISRVVAPVFGADGMVEGAIGVTLLGERVGKKRLAECSTLVLEAAERAKIAFMQEKEGEE